MLVGYELADRGLFPASVFNAELMVSLTPAKYWTFVGMNYTGEAMSRFCLLSRAVHVPAIERRGRAPVQRLRTHVGLHDAAQQAQPPAFRQDVDGAAHSRPRQRCRRE